MSESGLKISRMFMVVLSLFFSSSAFSMTESHLIEFLTQQITGADQAFQLSSSDLECRTFFLSFSGSGSVGVNGVIDLEVNPEITLIWERVAQ